MAYYEEPLPEKKRVRSYYGVLSEGFIHHGAHLRHASASTNDIILCGLKRYKWLLEPLKLSINCLY